MQNSCRDTTKRNKRTTRDSKLFQSAQYDNEEMQNNHEDMQNDQKETQNEVSHREKQNRETRI